MRTLGGAVGAQIAATLIADHVRHGIPLVGGFTLAFARALGEFGATLMLAGDIPGRTETLPLAIYFDIAAGQMRQAFGAVMVVLVVSLAVLFALGIWARAERRRRIPEK